MPSHYDALLIVSFGGPEGPDDVMPFFENVLRGKNVPRERMLAVAEHYQHFGGVSPINEQNRVDRGLEQELAQHGRQPAHLLGQPQLAPHAGRHARRWSKTGEAGVGILHQRLQLVLRLSAISGGHCHRAQEVVGSTRRRLRSCGCSSIIPGFSSRWSTPCGSASPRFRPIDVTPLPCSSPLIVSRSRWPRIGGTSRSSAKLPLNRGRLGHPTWELVYQSRSGPPTQPWLEPDVCDRIEQLHSSTRVSDLVILPVGFISDHLEVLFDIDTEAHELCNRLGITMHRAATAGTHPRFVEMIRLLIEEPDGRARAVGPRVSRPQPRRMPRGLLSLSHCSATAIGAISLATLYGRLLRVGIPELRQTANA